MQAVRRGYWVVLDELNLAPSDVLEALNRLLDDNRELFVPELQETIRPHPTLSCLRRKILQVQFMEGARYCRKPFVTDSLSYTSVTFPTKNSKSF